MSTIKLTDFFRTDFVNYASYDNTRKIASYIDGLKSGSRKVIYTILEKDITEPLKVSQLASKVAEFAEYLHGSLDGVIVTLAQDYCGTNNLPLLKKKGNFGTRFTPEASAPRYIFASGSDEFFKMFNREDIPVLEHQHFEGAKIEPRFYTPCLPVILVNGSEGVSSGFAQKILPRKPADVVAALKSFIKTGKTTTLKPWFKDFKGTIEAGENPNQWLIKGVIKRIAQTKLQIDELPVGYDLKSYIKVLDDLSDSGAISDYKDLSDSEFKFIITLPRAVLDKASEEDLLTRLKLIKKVTENFTCMSEDNSIIEFSSAEDIIGQFAMVKFTYLGRRKAHNVSVLKDKVHLLEEKIRFLKLVVDAKLVVANRSRDELEADLTANGFTKINESWDYLLGQKIWNLTQEQLEKLTKELAKEKTEYNRYVNTSIENIWLKELDFL